MTDELQPFVRDLLDQAIEDHDLDPAVVQALIDRAKRQEDTQLEESVRTILRRA